MLAKFALLLGAIGRLAVVDADDGTLKAFMDNLPMTKKSIDAVSKHLSPGFKDGSAEEEMHEKGFLEKGISHHAIDSDRLALKEKGLVLENPELLGKILKMVLGEEFKKEGYAEDDLKAALVHVVKLLESTVGDPFIKQEEFSKVLKDQHAVEDVLGWLKPKLELAGSTADKDVKSYSKDEDLGLFKAITELKASESMVPPFGRPVWEDYLKTLLLNEKSLKDDKHLDVLKSLERLKAESALNKEKLLAAKTVEVKDIPHPIVLGKEHLLKDDIAASHHSEKPFASEEEFKNRKTFHDEKVTHHKDFVFDEILKHEEAHAYGDDLGTKESSEFDEELYPHSFLSKVHKTAELDKADLPTEEKGRKIDEGIKQLDKASLDTSKKDLSSEAFLNKGVEKSKKIGEDIKQEGTHAYEKAKDQAHKDATIPFSEEGKDGILFDETLKTILSGTKEEVGKVLPETKIYNEEALKKEKALMDGKKLFEEHDITKGIHHRTKVDDVSKGVHHGIKVDEGISKGIHHGIKVDEGISKGIHHGIKVDEGITKGIHHGLKLDEEIGKGIKEAKNHFVRDKHIHLSAPEEIHKALSTDLVHSKAQFLKQKVLEILSHIFQMKKCHLVSMKPGELLSIVNCISKSKDPVLCEKFTMCEKKMPPQVILALELCQKELIPEQALRCSKYEPLYPSPDIPIKIFQCIVKNTRELLPEEKKQMIAFEVCARQIKTESCGRIPWG